MFPGSGLFALLLRHIDTVDVFWIIRVPHGTPTVTYLTGARIGAWKVVVTNPDNGNGMPILKSKVLKVV